MKILARLCAVACAGLLLAPLPSRAQAVSVSAAEWADPLDVPASASALGATQLLNGLARAGSRIVAVGQRGHILLSDDEGRNWWQAEVPVSVDLVAVHFPSARRGWAVGHDGVVLATADGGEHWTRQFDGRLAARTMAEHYARTEPELAAEGLRNMEQGPDKPFLDVWFEDERSGFIVGAFNLIFHTGDGGETWQPWLERTDNPDGMHLYAVRGIGEDVFIAGEQGLMLKLDRAAGRFRALATPYQGSYFGIAGKAGVVLAYGLRGNVYRSTDGGSRWTKVGTGVQAAITAATTTPDGRLLLASQGGQVLVSDDDGASFHPLALSRPAPTSAMLAPGADDLVLSGLRGVRVERLRHAN